MKGQEVHKLFPDMIKWRRYLHQHPELSFHEEHTAAFVASTLRSFDIDVRTGVGGHGVIGTIYGSKPGKTVVLRADMDALPIQDEKTVEYASKTAGVMHACGHDGHTATLLAVARYFKERPSEIEGEIRLLFQPSEEVCPGGAVGVIKDGALEGADVIYGVHLWTPIDVGTVASAPGPLMAAADEFFIDITGKGGHGGMPHMSVDSVVAASALVMQLQTIVSRSVDPLIPAVVTVGTINGGAAQNVIAETCRITGTVRTFDEDTRMLIRRRIEQMTEMICAAYNTEASIRYVMGYPPLVNNDEETSRFFREAVKVFGEDKVGRIPKLMPAEDFSYYLENIPGCFMFVGAGNEAKGAVYPHHHPKFDFDEDAMIHAANLLIAMTQSYLTEMKS
ncbi:M20 family metallopeptidase [Paenibacillus sediminis]|uniref:Amidohydrolase n=1 Tax=Paenibacillus sediminis TaxID=664909 RepID=A0ABS4GZ54_9BACL|nr:M20 family metallopeptidase [Paenibacillus sediminis]MBP1935552.1 amidohydrolase [Paenibacillus sediminis]